MDSKLKNLSLFNRKKNYSILVAEDNELMAKLILTLLETSGHKVAVARNGKIAVDMARAVNFDAILMDIDMPEMSGDEAAKNIRKFNNDTTIISITNYMDNINVQKCVSSGMDGHISKANSVEKLEKMMVSFIEKKKTSSCVRTAISA